MIFTLVLVGESDNKMRRTSRRRMTIITKFKFFDKGVRKVDGRMGGGGFDSLALFFPTVCKS